MDIKGNRFLVIGGAGLIGSHLVEQLLQSGAKHVRVYDNFSRGTYANLQEVLSDQRLEIFADGGDILHADILKTAMEGMDGVFHLAALWLLQCNEYPRSAFDVNVTGTMNVVEAVIATGVKRLVYSSSASVYGDAITETISEDHPLNCQEFYGASKVCGEVLIRALYQRERAKGDGFQYVGLRYMNVYGSRQDDKGAYVGVIMRMLRAVEAGEQPVVHGDGSQSYDFVEVRDCARANILAMQSEVSNSCFNVGTGIKTSITELAEKLTSLYGNGLAVRYEGIDRPFVRNRIGATERAASEIGFTSTIDLDRGLKELIKWHRSVSGGRVA